MPSSRRQQGPGAQWSSSEAAPRHPVRSVHRPAPSNMTATHPGRRPARRGRGDNGDLRRPTARNCRPGPTRSQASLAFGLGAVEHRSERTLTSASEERSRQRASLAGPRHAPSYRQEPSARSDGAGQGGVRARARPAWLWRAHLKVRERSAKARRSLARRQRRNVPADRADLSFEADWLVVARRRTHVAQRQPIFDKSGPSASLAAVQCDRVLAYRAAKQFRVHAIASRRHPHHPSARFEQLCVAWWPGRSGGSAQPLYTGSRPTARRRTCDVCSKPRRTFLHRRPDPYGWPRLRRLYLCLWMGLVYAILRMRRL
jgi:hypothetical protein